MKRIINIIFLCFSQCMNLFAQNVGDEERVKVLKEFTVRAEKIRSAGDTISFLTSTFAKESDRTIGDVMKRMPGIEVEASGKIRYQGLDINKFYIEGRDLLGGKYNIFTKI